MLVRLVASIKVLLVIITVPLFIKGIYNFVDSDEIVYELMDFSLGGLYTFNPGNEKLDSSSESYPRIQQKGKYIFSAREGNSVLMKSDSGAVIDLSKDGYTCAVWDKSNWSCTQYMQVDALLKPGVEVFKEQKMIDGKYSVYISDWDFEKLINVSNLVDVSWLKYVSVGCKWAFLPRNGGLLRCLGHIYFD